MLPSGSELVKRLISFPFVDVLIGEQWSSVVNTPTHMHPVQNLILHEERIYIGSTRDGNHCLAHCSLKEFKDSLKLSRMEALNLDMWQEMEIPVSTKSPKPYASFSIPYYLASFGQRLVFIDNRSHKISAYSPVMKSWIVVGDFYVDCIITGLIKLPDKSIFIIERDNDLRFFSASLWTLGSELLKPSILSYWPLSLHVQETWIKHAS